MSGVRSEDEFARVDLDADGQGTAHVFGHVLVRAYYACAVCGEATGSSRHSCPDHPLAMRFLKHDRIPA